MMNSHSGRRIKKADFESHLWVEDLVFFEGPLVSFVKGSLSQDFIYIFVDSGQTNRWLLIPVDRSDLLGYKNREFSLLDILNRNEEVFLADLNEKGDYESVWEINASALPEDYLPGADSLFDPELCPSGNDAILAPSDYQISLNGSWFLEELTKLPKLFIEMYSFIYALEFSSRDSVRYKSKKAFSGFPWKGGFSAVYFYRSLNALIPSLHEPKIRSMEYNSPGYIRLELLSTISEITTRVASSLATNKEEANVLVKQIRKFMKDKGYTSLREEDELPELPNTHKRYLHDSTHRLLYLMDMNSYKDDLFDLASNELVATKIVLSFHKRADDVNKYSMINKMLL